MFDLGGDFILITINYIKDLFKDLSPLLFVIFGLIIGIWILENIFNFFGLLKREEREEEEEEEEEII